MSDVYSESVSDTQVTPTDHIENVEAEERRTFHWKVAPSKAAQLAVYAKRNGMLIGGALEKAISLLCATKSV